MDNPASISDREYMAMAIQLAARGTYSTQPNPRVGCVIVKDNAVIGRGWHQLAGEPHAEIHALREAGESARGATAYVTLEPCAHTGKTGPCCEALVEAGIARVVIGMQDPNPLVSGKGATYLRQHQLDIIVPLMLEQCAELNPGFIKRQQQRLPYLRCKLAMSLDGRTALSNGQSKWITGAAARADVQKLRARSCAIVTGINTVIADDPAMTIRKEQLDVPDMELALRKQPLRVVLDTDLRISLDAKILDPVEEVMVICSEDGGADSQKLAGLVAKGVQVVRLPGAQGKGLDLKEVFHFLADKDCNEVLIESGAGLAGAMIDSGLLDELVIYVSPKFMGHTALPLLELPEYSAMDKITELKFREIRQLGKDLRITAVF
jgi:diaminohydroxyphosphoribosylaminopyrimidine deaminase/5-amino-6-(5-phosphoribosylamino)uracil reductase